MMTQHQLLEASTMGLLRRLSKIHNEMVADRLLLIENCLAETLKAFTELESADTVLAQGLIMRAARLKATRDRELLSTNIDLEYYRLALEQHLKSLDEAYLSVERSGMAFDVYQRKKREAAFYFIRGKAKHDEVRTEQIKKKDLGLLNSRNIYLV